MTAAGLTGYDCLVTTIVACCSAKARKAPLHCSVASMSSAGHSCSSSKSAALQY